MEQISFTKNVDPRLIEVNPFQPRSFFDDEKQRELESSIQINGILQPLLVQKGEGAFYVLIAGERRLRACLQLGLKEIPVLVKEASTNSKMLELALIENVQRSNLNIMEEARAYLLLQKDYSFSPEQISEAMGKDRTTVVNTLRLLKLPKMIQKDLQEDRLSGSHGRVILSLEDEEIMLQARDIVIKKSLSVRQTEILCKRMKKNPQKNLEDFLFDPNLEYLAENLRSFLRTKVKISGNTKKGRIEISYFSPAELERLMGILKN